MRGDGGSLADRALEPGARALDVSRVSSLVCEVQLSVSCLVRCLPTDRVVERSKTRRIFFQITFFQIN